MGARERREIGAQEIIDALPMFAMVMDENHQVIRANSWFATTLADEGDECPVACYETVHHTTVPHPDCPLSEAVRTNRMVKRDVLDDARGKLRVTIVPIPGRFGADRLFLHLTEAT